MVRKMNFTMLQNMIILDLVLHETTAMHDLLDFTFNTKQLAIPLNSSL